MFNTPRFHLRATLVPAAAALILFSVAAPGFAEPGPERPSDPDARDTSVADAYAAPAPATPNVPHTGPSGAFTGDVEPRTVDFSDVALSSVPESVGPPRAHIQGEILLGETGRDLVAPKARPTGPIDRARPSGSLDKLASKALGDVGTNFDGLANTGWIPPDTVVAVGPSHVLESTNSGVAIYGKGGSPLVGYTTFDLFFDPVKPVGWSGFMFDPRVLFSAEHGKYVILVLGLDQVSQTSYIYLAVSQTNSATGTYWIWRINSNFAGFTGDSWLDYAGLGADTWGVYFTGNYFLWTGGYKYSTIISLDPAVFSGGAISGWQFVDIRWPNNSLADSPQPALPMSIAGGAETFFVNSYSGFGSQINLWTLTGDRDNSPSLSRAAVSVSSYEALGENVDQPGSATDIDGGDSRIMNAFYSQRRVYTTLTSDTNGNLSSSGALVAKLNVDSNLSEWNTTLDGGVGWYYFFPAVAIGDPIDTSPPVSLFLSWTHPAGNFYASGAVRTYEAPPGDTSGPFPATALGLASYVALDSNNRNRWGDYSGAGYDWQSGTMWGAVEYAGTGNTWRTRITELEPAAEIFSDGFESGNTSAWSFATP